MTSPEIAAQILAHLVAIETRLDQLIEAIETCSKGNPHG